MEARGPGIDTTEGNIRGLILSLSWPAIVRMLLVMSVGIVDIMMIGRLGEEDPLAAVGLSNQYLWLFYSLIGGVSVGTTALIAQHLGAKEREEASRIAKQSILLGSLLALAVSIPTALNSEQLILWLGATDKVAELGGAYLRIVLGVLFFSFNLWMVNAIFQGAGNTKTPMYIMAFVNTLNIALDYLLIFGIGPFPKLGVIGAATASAVSRILGAVIGWTLLLKGRYGVTLSLGGVLKPYLREMKRILWVGIPASIEMLLRSGSNLFYMFIIASLGTTAIAAHQVAIRAESFSYMPGFGFAIAATTIVGQNIGAGKRERAERSGLEASYLALLFMGFMGIIFFLFPFQFMGIFTVNERVIELGAPCLMIVALSEPGLALNMVLAGGLRGAGDTKYPMIITGFGSWCIRLPLAYFLAITLGYGLIGAYMAMTFDVILRGIIMLVRFRSEKWKEMNLRK